MKLALELCCDLKLIVFGIIEKHRLLLQVHPKFGPCDLEIIRPRMERALSSLGKKELDEARMQEGQLDPRAS